MSLPKQLAGYGDAVHACVRCGACHATCPAYGASGREESAARGKIALAAGLLAGDLELDAETCRAFSQCLLCGACSRNCPNKVPADAVVAAVRREISAEQGLSRVGRFAALTGHPRLLGSLTRGAGLLSPLFFRRVPRTSGLHLRLAPAALRDRLLPPLSLRGLFSRLPERLAGRPGQPTVAFFAGCGLTWLYPEVGEAAVRVLHRLGYTVILPRSQGCCGMPALSSGNAALVEDLVRANIAAFAEAEHVITACASCSGMLGHWYRDLHLQNEAAHSLAGKMADKVVDIHDFLRQEGQFVRFAALPRIAPDQRIRVCWHDPCHLKNRGVIAAPREFLRTLPQVDFAEMEGADLCCGLGGTFSATQPAASRAIADRKIPGLAASGAAIVATGCPGCLMQLADTIHRAGLPMRTAHSMTLALAALETAGAAALPAAEPSRPDAA